MSILALVVFSGLGLAANAAVPGDFLYGLDLAMEKVGIGAGGIEERISEAQGLADRGQHAEAADHLKASIVKYGDEASAEEVAQAIHALDEYEHLVDGNETPDIAPPPANENAGPGNNNAGGNSDNAGPGNNNAGGNSDNAPGNNNAGGNSDNAPGNTAPDNSDNAGPGNNNAGGNSDNAPGNTAPGNTAPGNSDNAGPGNNNGGGGGKGGN